jgi:hypothetical protein
MGCTISRILGRGRKYATTGAEAVEAHVAAGAPAAAAGAPSSKATDPPVKRVRLDPKDFMFMKLKGETRVKLPGSVVVSITVQLLLLCQCSCAVQQDA